jgi:hypothetical protein
LQRADPPSKESYQISINKILERGRSYTSLVEEKAPFQNKYKSIKNKNMFMSPDGTETKNDYAGEAQQQFTGLDWTGLDMCRIGLT